MKKLKKQKIKSLTQIENLKTDITSLSESIQLLKKVTIDESLNTNTVSSYLHEKARDSIFRFFSVIDSIEDLVIIQDATGKWKTLNKFGQNLFDLIPSQFVGKTSEDLIELKPFYDEILTKCSLVSESIWDLKVPVRSIEFFNIKDKIIYFDIIKTPTYYSDGVPKELIILGRDITDLIKTQQRNKACIFALNSASDIILIIDGGGYITFCNDSFLKNFRFTSSAQVENKPMSILNSGKMTKEFFKDMWLTIRSNKIWTGSIINKCFDDTLLNCFVTILPVMNCEQYPIYYICTMKITKSD